MFFVTVFMKLSVTFIKIICSRNLKLSVTSPVFEVMSGKDLDQCMIDLLYGYTIASNTDTLVRKKIVSEINKLMLPYIKG